MDEDVFDFVLKVTSGEIHTKKGRARKISSPGIATSL
jgi:hypothetical protein